MYVYKIPHDTGLNPNAVKMRLSQKAPEYWPWRFGHVSKYIFHFSDPARITMTNPLSHIFAYFCNISIIQQQEPVRCTWLSRTATMNWFKTWSKQGLTSCRGLSVRFFCILSFHQFKHFAVARTDNYQILLYSSSFQLKSTTEHILGFSQCFQQSRGYTRSVKYRLQPTTSYLHSMTSCLHLATSGLHQMTSCLHPTTFCLYLKTTWVI